MVISFTASNVSNFIFTVSRLLYFGIFLGHRYHTSATCLLDVCAVVGCVLKSVVDRLDHPESRFFLGFSVRIISGAGSFA